MIPEYLMSDRDTLERISQSKSQAVPMGKGAILCRILGKYLIYMHTEDIGITPHLCFSGFWESWITVALARELKPGMHCLDIGANHGYYTLIMADAVETEGLVLALEPNPTVADLLNQSLEVNGFKGHASAMQLAAYDRDFEEQYLFLTQKNGLNATLCRKVSATDDKIAVKTVTIDGITKDWPKVDMIKIDAEGAEDKIWHGMKRTLENNLSVVIISEFHRDRYENPALYLKKIKSSGFQLRYIDYDSNIINVSEEQILSSKNTCEWMLFLRRF